MDLILAPTTERHTHLVSSFFGNVMGKLARKELLPLQENNALLYEGSLLDNLTGKLIDVKDLKEEGIDWDLNLVYPDFMIFKDNKYFRNLKGTKFIGCPDLIVEVWSESNTSIDKTLKFNLYSSSDKTEHWYITQDSNIIECWKGSLKLSEQNMNNILLTQSGLKLDIRHLALK